MISFSFHTPTQIHFGQGSIGRISTLLSQLGERALVVAGGDTGRLSAVMAAIDAAGVPYDCVLQRGEPTIAQVVQGAQTAREKGAEVVVAVGGGSVVDAGKAIAALAVNHRPVMTYLEVIGEGKPLELPPLPLVAVPTTAGTGAEVTFNSVLSSPEHGVKVSLRSPLMAPDVAIVDPLLTLTVPPQITAFSGMDALTQLMEAFISRFATPLTDALCREGIKQVAASLKQCHNNGKDVAAREGMCLAALISGIVLSHAKLGAVHGLAGPMGGMVDIPHGAACARLLGPVMAANLCRCRAGEICDVEKKLDKVGVWLTGRSNAAASDAVAWIEALTAELEIPPLSRYALTREQFDPLARQALRSSSMKGNPVALTRSELMDILGRGR